MNLTVLTLIESIYLLYMFFIFKTKYNISTAFFDKEIQSINPIFIHNSNKYENKICLFGKFMAVIAIVLVYLRLNIYNTSNVSNDLLVYTTVIFDCICIILASIMNTNALVYITPLIICEIFIVYNLYKY